MTPDIILVFIILGAAILLFITNRIRVDLVGLLILGSLAITGLVTPTEALSGFSNPAVITVWAVLILSGGLARTGIASKIGRFVLRLAGDSEIRLLAIVMLTSGVLSGLMNSIGVVSLYLPVVIDIARRTNRPPSRLLIPLAFASLLGGLNTLIGTPPNILISEALSDAGFTPFQMFDFTPIGITVLLAGTLFMILVGRHLLPKRDITRELGGKSELDVTDLYAIQERMAFIHLPQDSSLDGKSLQESRLGSALELNVVTVIRTDETILAPNPSFLLRAGDRLLVEGQLDRLFELHDHEQLLLDQDRLPVEKIISADVRLAEVKLSKGSSLAGLTLPQVAFRHTYRAIVLAIRRGEAIFYTDLESIPLMDSDVLLIKGWKEDLAQIQTDDSLFLLDSETFQDYHLEDLLMMMRVPEESALVGNTLLSNRLGDAFGLSVRAIIPCR